MTRMSNHLNLNYYFKHKEEQTDTEWRKIEIIHRFLSQSSQLPFVSREQRSLMLFCGEVWLGESEAEKWLIDKEGKAAKNSRLHLRMSGSTSKREHGKLSAINSSNWTGKSVISQRGTRYISCRTKRII